MDPERELLTIAARQDGVFDRAQALAAGVSARQLRYRVRRGRLVVLHAGVYAIAGAPGSFRRALRAALLAAGPRAVASHRAAAVLLGLPRVPGRIELSVPRFERPRLLGVSVHRVVSLEPADVTRRDGIALTRVARTLVDLAGVLAGERLELVLDDALGRRLVTPGEVRARLEALGRRARKGAGVLGRLLAARPEGRPLVQSTFEQRLHRTLSEAGIRGGRPQFRLELPGGRHAFADLAFPRQRLILEADGFAHHGTLGGWSRDHTRRAELVALGWRVLPITWDQLDARPGDVVRIVRAALAPRRAGALQGRA